MKITLLENWINGDDTYYPDDEQILSVPDKVGERLIEDGIAERSYNQDEQEARARGRMTVDKKRSKLLSVMASGESAKSGADIEEVTLKEFYFGENYRDSNDSFGGDYAAYLRAIAGSAKGQWDNKLKTLTIADETAAGFLVPDVLYAGVYDRVKNLPSILNRCMKFQTEGSGLKIPAFYDYDWSSGLYSMEAPPAAEDSELLEVEPELEQLAMELHKQGFILPVTNELLEDSRVSLSSILPVIMASATSFGLDKLILKGTGAAQPLGIMNSDCLITVPKETDQVAATIAYANLLKMYARLVPGADTGAVWLVSRSCIPQLGQLSLTVGTGGSAIWVRDASSRLPGTMFGIPIIVHPHCETIGTAGDIILANFNAYGILSKSTSPLMRIDYSQHVEFKKDKGVFRLVCRVDGQPLMSTTLTDTDGTTTLSNFVALATRS